MTPFLLIAEDDPLLTEVIKHACLQAGFSEQDLHFFSTGAHLIDFLKRLDPATIFPRRIEIITDIQMPECDGLGVLAWVRACPPYKDVPVTLMSSGLTNEIRLSALSLNATKVISKPILFPDWINLFETSLQIPVSARLAPPPSDS